MIRNTFSLLTKVFAVVFILIFSFALMVYLQFPSDKEIKGCLTTKMYKVHLCPSSDSYVRLGGISSYLKKAVVLTEDGSFYNHQGFDYQELEKSLKKNIEKGKFARGGSTITQQLAKNLFLTKEKTITRKLTEAFITMRLEKILSKNDILEKYLNVVQFGKDIFGVKQASQFYFKKSAADLSVVESAFLAFLLPGPEVYSKSFFRKQLTPFAKSRLRQIVDQMYQYNRINDTEYLSAIAQLEFFLGKKPVVIQEVEEINEEDAPEFSE